MKTALLILFSILSASVFAQELRPRVLKPVRVAVIASAGEDWDFRKDVLRELQRLRAVEVSANRPDVTIQVAAERFQGDCRGVVAAVFVRARTGSELHVFAGADWQEIARALVARIRENVEKGE